MTFPERYSKIKIRHQMMGLPDFVVIIFGICGGVIFLICSCIFIDCFIYPICRRNRTERRANKYNYDDDEENSAHGSVDFEDPYVGWDMYKTFEEQKLPNSPQPENNNGIIYVNNVYSPKYTPLKAKRTTLLPKDSTSKNTETTLTVSPSNFELASKEALVGDNSSSPVIDITEVSVEGLQLYNAPQHKEIHANKCTENLSNNNSYNSISFRSRISFDTKATPDSSARNVYSNHLTCGVSTGDTNVDTGNGKIGSDCNNLHKDAHYSNVPSRLESNSDKASINNDNFLPINSSSMTNDVHVQKDAYLSQIRPSPPPPANGASSPESAPPHLNIHKPAHTAKIESSYTVPQHDINQRATASIQADRTVDKNQDLKKTFKFEKTINFKIDKPFDPVQVERSTATPPSDAHQERRSSTQTSKETNANINNYSSNDESNFNFNSQTPKSSNTNNVPSKNDPPDAKPIEQKKPLKKSSYYYKPLHKYALNSLYRRPSSSSSSPEFIKSSSPLSSSHPHSKRLSPESLPTTKNENSKYSKGKDVDYAAELKHCNQKELHFRLLLQKMNNAALREEMLLPPRTLPPRIVIIAEDISSREISRQEMSRLAKYVTSLHGENQRFSQMKQRKQPDDVVEFQI